MHSNKDTAQKKDSELVTWPYKRIARSLIGRRLAMNMPEQPNRAMAFGAEVSGAVAQTACKGILLLTIC